MDARNRRSASASSAPSIFVIRPFSISSLIGLAKNGAMPMWRDHQLNMRSKMNVPEVFEGLAERKVAFCNIDQPLFRGSLGRTDEVTARVGYVRLHGRNAADWFREDAGPDERYNYLYTVDELDEWLKKIDRIRRRAAEVYVITNNHFAGQAIVNAFEIMFGLGQRGLRPPDSLVQHYPRLNKVIEGA